MTTTVTAAAPAWWLTTESLMAAADPSFAHRPQQAAAAGIVDSAMRSRSHAALDLPTGSGKSLIALAAAEQAKGRTVISTATKALQAQMRDKDVPNLKAAGVLTKDVVILEGRGNYACLSRAVQELEKLQPAGKKVVRMVTKHLRSHNTDPDFSRRDNIPVAIPDWIWARICSDADACRALECRAGTVCAYTQVRNSARIADIVVINHSLLLADATIKGGDAVNWGLKSPSDGDEPRPGVLGPYRNLIIDEAHALENAAESFGEQRVTVRGIQALATRISKHEMSGAATMHMAECLDELRTGMLGLPVGALLAPTGSETPIFAQAANEAREAGKAIRGGSSTFEKNVAAEILVAACYSLAKKLEAIDLALRTGSDEFGPRAVSADETGIKSQLVDAGPWLVEHLFNMVPTIAMSGTLAVPGQRDWVPTRIGLDAKVQMLPTSFDLKAQRLVYVTPRTEGARRCFDGEVY